MEQHHYNLSSGSNLNPECPLPTVLRVLESAGSLLKSFLYLFSRIIAKVFFFFEDSSYLCDKTQLIYS